MSRRAAKKPLLSKKNIKDRLTFCRKYRDWTAEDWGKVIFSDEAPFRLFGTSGQMIGEEKVSTTMSPKVSGGPVSGSVLPAHRAVLVARCDVMAAMFSGKYAEARSRVVPIHGVSSDTFLAFLEYLYTDTCCPASVLQAMAILVCAEMYQVKRLQHLCEVCVCAYLQSMPSRELASTSISVIRLLRRAKCHNADQLYVWLLHFIANNYLIFSHKPDFLELSEEEREQVEHLRWPSRGYLQELSEYQRRRRQVRKSRCSIM
uniref:BTB domain-containing protein n=1 Tax=Electrophorus electricus TaxID=8005 RepID=A0A4W4G5F6_ELEEL